MSRKRNGSNVFGIVSVAYYFQSAFTPPPPVSLRAFNQFQFLDIARLQGKPASDGRRRPFIAFNTVSKIVSTQIFCEWLNADRITSSSVEMFQEISKVSHFSGENAWPPSHADARSRHTEQRRLPPESRVYS
jgi:hypothetical protein